jgi:hypothetical protein
MYDYECSLLHTIRHLIMLVSNHANQHAGMCTGTHECIIISMYTFWYASFWFCSILVCMYAYHYTYMHTCEHMCTYICMTPYWHAYNGMQNHAHQYVRICTGTHECIILCLYTYWVCMQFATCTVSYCTVYWYARFKTPKHVFIFVYIYMHNRLQICILVRISLY